MTQPLPPATATTDNRTPQQRLTDHLNTLASQPGQAWIGQLANDPKVAVQWKQTQAAAEHWNYSHEGLTPEAAAVIAIAVTYCTAGVAGSAAVLATAASLQARLGAAEAAAGASLKGRVNHSVCKWCYPKVSLDEGFGELIAWAKTTPDVAVDFFDRALQELQDKGLLVKS